MIVKVSNIKPLFNSLIVTMEKYPDDIKLGNSDLVDTDKAGNVKEYQKVVAIGPMVRDIQVGDTVFIDPARYARTQHKKGTLRDDIVTDNPVIAYHFDVVEMDEVPYLFLQSNDIKYIADVEEVIEVVELEA